MHPRFSTLMFTTAALIALGAAPAAGGPEGGTVVGGAATIQGQGGPKGIVNQSRNSAIINWNSRRACSSINRATPRSRSIA
jgi:hypothetical protein